MPCPSCATINNPGARFCAGCGATLAVGAPTIALSPTPAQYIQADEMAPLAAPPQPHGPIIVSDDAGASAGLTGKAKGLWNGTYGRSQAFFDRLIPPPVTTRRANPYLAAALELLGYVGVLGMGRIYAGDTAGGIRACVLWLAMTFSVSAVFSISGTIALIAAIPTFGLSLLGFALMIVPLMIPWLVLPLGSALKLFAQLQRWQSRP